MTARRGGLARGAGVEGANEDAEDDDDDDDDDDKMNTSEQALEEYFFPKFLTSPDLLDLEVSVRFMM